MTRIAFYAVVLAGATWHAAAPDATRSISASSAILAAAPQDAERTTKIPMAALWVEPEPGRDLLNGPGGRRLAPDPSARYRILERKDEGFSRGYTVADPGGRTWKVKFQPEAQTEVVASRIFWAVGYHQPPVYYLERWTATGAEDPNPQGAARFREEKPAFRDLTEDGHWAYDDNPFVGSTQLKGMLVLHVLLGNSDLKPEQNMVYTLRGRDGNAERWYVARDLGQTLGKTGVIKAPRNDIEVFEKTKFITGVDQGTVMFEYSGRHGQLLQQITTRDVRWISERLARLRDQDWRAAFRAGGYSPELTDRFVRKIKERIAEGVAVGQRS